MVIHISHRYIHGIYIIELKLSVFMMTGSHPGFLLDAGHVWRTSQDLFLRVHNWNSTRGKPCVNRMDLRAFMYQKGIATGIAWGLARVWKKKRNNSKLCTQHEWTDCISRYCKVSLLVVHHIAFHGLEPLSRQKSTSQEDSYNNTFAGFSDIITTITIPLAPAIGIQ